MSSIHSICNADDWWAAFTDHEDERSVVIRKVAVFGAVHTDEHHTIVSGYVSINGTMSPCEIHGDFIGYVFGDEGGDIPVPEWMYEESDARRQRAQIAAVEAERTLELFEDKD